MIKHAKTACVGLGHSWMSVLTGFFYTVTACCSSKANELLEARNWSRSEHRCLMAAVTIWCPHLSTKYLSLAAFNKRTIKSRHKHTQCIYSFYLYTHYQRKFRNQTSDNMHRWKAEQGRGKEKRKIRREKSRRERARRKKMQMREKVGKSWNTVFFQWFVAPEGRKVGSLKRRVRSQLARWVMKKCTLL